MSSKGATETVLSPFFFLCHHPRPGEPNSLGGPGKDGKRKDVTLTVSVAGEKKLDLGYEPHVVYESEYRKSLTCILMVRGVLNMPAELLKFFSWVL